jgi:hypothetical protein
MINATLHQSVLICSWCRIVNNDKCHAPPVCSNMFVVSIELFTCVLNVDLVTTPFQCLKNFRRNNVVVLNEKAAGAITQVLQLNMDEYVSNGVINSVVVHALLDDLHTEGLFALTPIMDANSPPMRWPATFRMQERSRISLLSLYK